VTRAPRAAELGFTLLDVVVSLALAAVVMMVTASIVTIRTRALTAAGGLTDEQHVVRSVLDDFTEVAAEAEHRSAPRETGTHLLNPAIAEWVRSDSFHSIAFRVPPPVGTPGNPGRTAAIVVRYCWDASTGHLWRIAATEPSDARSAGWPLRPDYRPAPETAACGVVPRGFVSEIRPRIAALGRATSAAPRRGAGGTDPGVWRFSAFDVTALDAGGRVVTIEGDATSDGELRHPLWRVARVRVVVAVDSNQSGAYDRGADFELSRTILLRQTF
jgi:hypothetical protein